MMELPEPNTILVVDDEESLRFFLSEELAEQGYTMYTAANGQEALDLLEKVTVDLAIIDLQMPGLNGLELMEAIQSLADAPELIMLTAHATLEISIEAMRRGCSDFLLKPYDFDELLTSVAQVMARRRQKVQQQMAARLLTNSLGLGNASAPEAKSKPADKPQKSTTSSSTLEMRGLSVDMEAMTVARAGELLSLTPTEFRLLVTLMKRPNYPHRFKDLAEVTHDQDIGDMEARDLLSSHIGRLRNKLGQAEDGQNYIVNVRGVGYKFIGSEM
jgi:DNA-binding response OmpR family regulator